MKTNIPPDSNNGRLPLKVTLQPSWILVLVYSLLTVAAAELTDDQKRVLSFETEDWTGVEILEHGAKEGSRFALWTDHPKNLQVATKEIPHDWSAFGAISLAVSNRTKTPGTFWVVLESRKQAKVWSYYICSAKVEPGGWQLLSLPLAKFKATKDPAGWQKIDRLIFAADGWGISADPTAEWALDEIRLLPGNPQSASAPAAKPDWKRVEEIAALLPARPTPVLLVPATNRARWQAMDTNHAAAILARGNARLESGIPPFQPDLYLAYAKQGKRTADPMMGTRNVLLTDLVLAECVENKGRFLPMIEAMIESLARDPSWLLSAHDPNLDNYEGRRQDIDLSVAGRALTFSGTLRLLDGRLSSASVVRLKGELQRRVFTPYRDRLTTGENHWWWMTGPNNWNAVCHAGVVLSALSVLEDPKERALFIHGAERGIAHYLAGTPGDGYCTEGIHYWGYGFGNFTLLSLGILEATGGRMNWFTNQKVAALGRFGRRMELMKGMYPTYADCLPTAVPSPWIVHLMDRLYPPGKLSQWNGSPTPVCALDPHSACQTTVPGSTFFTAAAIPGIPAPADGALRDDFPISGILNLRPSDPDAPHAFAVSIKGGHNAEEHNHNDLGGFVVSTPGTRLPLILDPGNEVYTARTFSSKRYDSRALSSFGHSVPRFGEWEQRPGRDAEALRIATNYSPSNDRLTLDLTSAYNRVPGLKSVTRSFTYERGSNTVLFVEDRFKAEGDLPWETALVTYGKWRKTGPSTFAIWADGDALRVEVMSASGDWSISSQGIEEDMGSKMKPTRIAVSLNRSCTDGSLKLRITRMDGSGI